MSYQVLARKWRPRQFSELMGQEHVVRALSNALDSGRIHHAFLFTGTRGVGKTTIARIFAKSLNCERGVSASPCGQCSSCTDIDAGRFVDLLEIDAASNTGVDDVRVVIENAQYVPSRGRYKVYLVDEVHMLSKNAFNALLKTLEEPPPHVKFLLATTDPQKLPVTVLSRCLQFSLKRLGRDQIVAQMTRILEAEGIAFEAPAIIDLARSADGSLRDGLSLLDQAIAYGAGTVRSAEARAMLGTVDRGNAEKLLEALADGDGAALLARVAELAEFAPDFAAVLDDLAGLLHRVQLCQLIPGYAPGADDSPALAALSERLSAEEVQLYYQIAILGRRDLYLAPHPRAGFEMCLLRMLAFRPQTAAAPIQRTERPVVAAKTPGPGELGANPSIAAMPPKSEKVAPAPRAALAVSAPVPAQAPQVPRSEVTTTAQPEGETWDELIERAALRGPARELASNSALLALESDHVRLALKPEHEHLRTAALVGSLQQGLSNALGRAVQVRFEAAAPAAVETPAQRRARAQSAKQQAAEQALSGDPVVQSLVARFDARIVPNSIKPLEE